MLRNSGRIYNENFLIAQFRVVIVWGYMAYRTNTMLLSVLKTLTKQLWLSKSTPLMKPMLRNVHFKLYIR